MKKILALVLAVLMVLGMAACAPADDANNPGGTTTTKEFTIKVWTPTEDQAEGNNWLVAMQEKFAAAHPEYKITWDNSTMGEGDAGAAVIADVTASADVYMFANDQLGKLINAGGLSKLVGDFETQVKNDNGDFMVNSVTHTDGAVYGFPVTNNTWFMYYNKDVFTADDVKSLDTMLTKGKVYLPFGTGWTSGCMFLGCGGSIFGAAGNDESAGIDFSSAKGGYVAAKKMIELVNNPNVVAGGMDISKMISGEVAATFNGSWVRGDMENAFKDKLGVAVLPKFTADGKEYQMTAMSGSKCVGVNPNSNAVEGKQLACTEFAAFLASEEAQLARYEMRGVIPSHKNLANNDKVKADAVAVAEIATINQVSVVQSALPGMDKYWGPVENFGNKVITGDINMTNYELQVDELNTSLNAEGV